MTPDQTRILIVALLAGHGLGHGGAIGALWWIATRPGPTGGWTPAHSWVLPSLATGTATNVAVGFWLASLLGFVGAALAFAFVPGEAWRWISVISALVSLTGIVLFAGTWPPFNMVAAVAANAVILIGLLVASWPPLALFGK